jgi:D-arabinose 1-dehydrogenase-like Zn-dependent alcohol dehydrogenase
LPGLQYPRVPGHEIAGRVDAVGSGVSQWTEGQRVGVGWHGGHCFVCDPCRHGDFAMCIKRKITGIDFDGGYAEYITVGAEAVAAIPYDLPSEEVGPFMCADVTVHNALRNSGARSGDLVAGHGIGGLGHLAVQYSRQMGFRTVAIGRGKDKEPLARKLGAHHYIDTDAGDGAAQLQKLGGARVIVATAPSGKAICGTRGGAGAGRQASRSRGATRSADREGGFDDFRKTIHRWRVFRHGARFTGHFGIQRPRRHSPYD